MLDPLSALNVAEAIVGFIDFGWRVVSLAQRIYCSKDSAIDGNREIEHVTTHLKSLNDAELRRLAESLSHQSSVTADVYWTESEKQLQSLALDCSRLTTRLLDLLKDLREQSSRFKTWDALRRSFKTLRKTNELEDVRKKLAEIRSQAALHLLHSLRDHQSSLSSVLQKLNDNLRASRLEAGEQLREAYRELLLAVGEPLRELKLSQDATERTIQILFDRFQAAIKNADKLSRAERILDSLYFDEMSLRQNQIPQIYKQTVDWIFDESKTKFVHWLKTLNGIFWICGRAGSGKSTLMKFVAQHDKTLEYLKNWTMAKDQEHQSDSRVLVVASHYFWRSGFPMQKSFQGLFQHLLYQILLKCPDLISTACPKQWQQVGQGRLQPTAWSLDALLEAFRCLLALEEWPAQFCFFIDGLDEYAGSASEQRSLIKEINRISDCPFIKICVSSRPWNVFTTAYSGSPDRMLVTQDHNKADLDIFIAGKLEADKCFRNLAAKDSRAAAFALEIRERANGVFLWVHLVVRSILDGLTEEDDIPLLQVRLRALPPNLEEYFEAMFRSIDPVYKQYTARALLIACSAGEPLPLSSYHYLSMEMADPEYALKLQAGRNETEEIIIRRKSLVRWVNKWCRDLLEVRDPAPTVIPTQDLHVEFLHRTVRDFLVTPEMRLILEKNAGSNFKAELSLCRSDLALAKLAVSQWLTMNDNFHLWAHALMLRASEYERLYFETPFSLLAELHQLGNRLNEMQNPERVNRKNTLSRSPGWVPWIPETICEPPRSAGYDFAEYTRIASEAPPDFLRYAQKYGLRLFLDKVVSEKLTVFGNIHDQSVLKWICDNRREVHGSVLEDESIRGQRFNVGHYKGPFLDLFLLKTSFECRDRGLDAIRDLHEEYESQNLRGFF